MENIVIPVGSTLYNLNTPDSDNDTMSIVPTLEMVSQQIKSGADDCRIVSVGFFASKVLDSQPVEVDILRSKTFKPAGKYEDYLRSLRFSPLHYQDRAYCHAFDFLSRKDFLNIGSGAQGWKNVKVACRVIALSLRVGEYGLSFCPEFNRSEFYSALNATHEALSDIQHLPPRFRAEKSIEIIFHIFKDVDQFLPNHEK